jgi:hypothetical protein
MLWAGPEPTFVKSAKPVVVNPGPASDEAVKTVVLRFNILRDLIWLVTGRDRYSPLDEVFDGHIGDPAF